MKNELNKIFAASECPSGEVLRQYHGGTLASNEMRTVEKHLVSCEACSDELEGMSYADAFEIEKTVNSLKKDITIKLGIKNSEKSFTLYFRIAAVIVVVCITSVIIYLTQNSNQKIAENSFSYNADKQKSPAENEASKAAVDEKKSEAIEKSAPGEKGKSELKDSKLRMEQKGLTHLNPVQESKVTGSTADGDLLESGKNGYLGAKSNIKEGEKINDKNDFAQVTAGVTSTNISQTGMGKASAKTVVIEATDQETNDIVIVSEQSDVKTKSGKEITKKEDANNYVLAENKNQQTEDYKVKSEKKEQLKDETVSLEKSKDNIEKKKEEQEKDNRKLAEESGKDLTFKEESTDKLTKSNSSTTESKNSKKKNKSESPQKINAAGSGESNVPSGNGKEMFDNAMDKFNAGRYDEASKLFEQNVASNGSDYKSIYYEGLCYYELGKAKKAIPLFETVINSNNSEFVDDARWYLALSYIVLKDNEKAKKNLEDIVKKGGKHKVKAEKKINEIK